MAVKVPTVVLETLEAIRRSGETNMLDRPRVQVIADRMEAYETVVWLEDNKKLYAQGIFEGFEAE